MSGITEVGFLALQAARLYLELAEASKEMTDEEALERFRAVGKRVEDANKMWEEAGQ